MLIFTFLHEKPISKLVLHHVVFFKGKHLEFSRTLKAYWSDIKIYRTFINFPYIFKIGEISPVAQMLHLPSFVKKNLERMFG